MYLDASKVQAMFTEEVNEIIFQKAIQNSFVMSHATRLDDMTGATTQLNIISQLPSAYWTNADIEHAKISALALKDKYIRAEEANVLVPISKRTLEDNKANLADLIIKRSAEAISALFDQTVLFGTNKPNGFREGIVPSAYALGAVVQSTGKLYTDVSKAMSKVEESDYEVTGIVGGLQLNGEFRNLLDANGNPITNNQVTNLPRHIVKNGAWSKAQATALVGDLSQIYFSVRKDITVDVFTEATIKDPNVEGLEYNLAQQKMVAFMLTFRVGWEIPNPVSRETMNKPDAFPFALLAPSTATAPNNQVTTLTIAQGSATTPVVGATVEFGGNNYVTNTSGQVTVKTFKNTDYPVNVFAEGYKFARTSVTTGESTTHTATIVLEPYGTYVNPENKSNTARTSKSNQ